MNAEAHPVVTILGTFAYCIASAVIPASMPPAAPSVCPVIDLVDDIASLRA